MNQNVNCLQTCINFKTSNNYLPIETVSWLRIERNERKSSKCNLNEIGDQFHYMFRCNFLMMTEENMFLWRMYAIQILCYLKQLCVNLIVRNLLIYPNLSKLCKAFSLSHYDNNLPV